MSALLLIAAAASVMGSSIAVIHGAERTTTQPHPRHANASRSKDR